MAGERSPKNEVKLKPWTRIVGIETSSLAYTPKRNCRGEFRSLLPKRKLGSICGFGKSPKRIYGIQREHPRFSALPGVPARDPPTSLPVAKIVRGRTASTFYVSGDP